MKIIANFHGDTGTWNHDDAGGHANFYFMEKKNKQNSNENQKVTMGYPLVKTAVPKRI